MKLNHINLTVTDVQAAKNVLETYFAMQCHEGDRGQQKFCCPLRRQRVCIDPHEGKPLNGG